MAIIIGNIKPDWTVIKYDSSEVNGRNIYGFCSNLISADLVIGGNLEHVSDGLYDLIFRIDMDKPKVLLKVHPDDDDNVLLRMIDAGKYQDTVWHEFIDYETMIQSVASDYEDWVKLSNLRELFKTSEEWISTNLGYEVLFPPYDDIEEIIFKN
ncbi:hypothetical protein COV11_02685 [Candidatus Woesearchaeota archaeon CG10_big_fil_rev_8_21_14_0_10_30_7]|nr:MAG: hypothetical protein COV11_02685 [Candidatus Woesearchaeota archaeon CG10_big_fil_rev_8_21_14_0_10_30_7]